ncbi:cytochrome c oxidase subunit II [Halosolutus gelatinilyticus]|uniref:cytochrome c oxidase subunit II n=1 Tax=Halosolutus gelatinilyticus TaxID=2931975 RepID=UPI001FF41E22|nr:cytochrome c oxidase subunit II [Halosolutus gelatinilyticus]
MSRRRRTIGTVLVTLAALLASTGSVVAQSVNRDAIVGLEYQLLYVALPLSLFVVMILVYAAVKFRDNDDPQPTAEDPALEITWTIATAIILLFVGVAGYSVLVNPYVSPTQITEPGAGSGEAIESVDDLPETDDEELVVRGYQWHWETTYPSHNITMEDELVLPANQDVTIWITTEDVIHSLFIPDLGVKQDGYPGEYTRIRTFVYEPGEYEAVCTEFCGVGHSRMDADVVVLEQDEYEAWLEENEDSRATAPDDP